MGAPIQDADIVVSFGKGLKDAKNAGLINELAEILGGSVGASRKVVDLGWIPYSHQVGLSGKNRQHQSSILPAVSPGPSSIWRGCPRPRQLLP